MSINGLVSSITDDVLHDVYNCTKYRDIILPVKISRRLDALLEPTHTAVMAGLAELGAADIPDAEQD